MKKLLLVLMVLSLFLYFTMPAQAGHRRPNPHQLLQQQIDELNAKLNNLLGQSCPEGQYVTGITNNGLLICNGSVVSEETTHTMNCAKSENETGLEGTDPFALSHANYQLEFAPEMTGRSMTVIAVETSSVGSSLAYVELKDPVSGDVLATSDQVSTSTLGWIEFIFTPGFTIDGDPVIVNFVASGDARIYNCANSVDFVPTGLSAIGLGLENHMGRSYIKIKN